MNVEVDVPLPIKHPRAKGSTKYGADDLIALCIKLPKILGSSNGSHTSYGSHINGNAL